MKRRLGPLTTARDQLLVLFVVAVKYPRFWREIDLPLREWPSQTLAVSGFVRDELATSDWDRVQFVMTWMRGGAMRARRIDAPSTSTKRSAPCSLLAAFRWFCSEATREEQVEPSISDIRRCIRRMRREGRSGAFIWIVTQWRSLCTILPIVVDGLQRSISAVWRLVLAWKRPDIGSGT